MSTLVPGASWGSICVFVVMIALPHLVVSSSPKEMMRRALAKRHALIASPPMVASTRIARVARSVGCGATTSGA